MDELTVVLGRYPHTAALYDGRVRSDSVRLRLVVVDPVNRAFAPMIRRRAYDVCEMALGAFLQSWEENAGLLLLPTVTAWGVHHESLRYLPARGALAVEDLRGQRVGIRAYSQTTGLWLRGALVEEYGIAHDEIEWVVEEGSHAASYVDPPFAVRAPEGTELLKLLRTGDVRAVVGLPESPPDIACLIPDVEQAALAWRERHGTVGINHMICVRDDLATSRPDLVAEVHRMLVESYRLARPPALSAPSAAELQGVTGIYPALTLAINYARQQQLITTQPDPRSLFALGD